MTTIQSYDEVITRIRRDGHLFNVGQIARKALNHIYFAQRQGIIQVSRDSWPIRGLSIPSGETVLVYELTEFAKNLEDH